MPPKWWLSLDLLFLLKWSIIQNTQFLLKEPDSILDSQYYILHEALIDVVLFAGYQI